MNALETHIVLVGCGNSHLKLLMALMKKPFKTHLVTMVNDSDTVFYSGRVTGFLAKEYTEEELAIDVGGLCNRAQVRLVVAKATEIDLAKKNLYLENYPPLQFDYLSLNLGVRPSVPLGFFEDDRHISVKPLKQFIEKIKKIEKPPSKIFITGGGDTGCEVGMSLKSRFPNSKVTIFSHNKKVPSTFRKALRETGVHYQHQPLPSTEDFGKADLNILATHGEGPIPDLKAEGLQRDENGFIKVNTALQSTSHPFVFASGDCISFNSRNLPRSGVYAVKEGVILNRNLRNILAGKKLISYKPQLVALKIFNSGNGKSILNYGPFHWYSPRARHWKARIDSTWMKNLGSPKLEMGEGMKCGGCGSKVGAAILKKSLEGVSLPRFPQISDYRDQENASFVMLKDESFQVYSIDFFRSFLRNPYDMAKIALNNSLNDIYAMNARPQGVLANIVLPFGSSKVQEQLLSEIMKGIEQVLQQENCALLGGHTSEGLELSLGFSVTGEGTHLFSKGNLESGEVLILTKPIGTGALLAADTLGVCKSDWYNSALGQMRLSNQKIGPLLQALGVKACTDVSGFGLLGHLCEMLEKSNKRAHIETKKIPLLAGFSEISSQGIRSSLYSSNLEAFGNHSRVTVSLIEPQLFDPQTSGGFLFGISTEKAPRAIEELFDLGFSFSTVIGKVE